MKHFLIISILFTLSFAELSELSSFEADFTQTITDDKGKVLSYSGKLKALKPQFALWNYETPVEKKVYIEKSSISIVEPELEQVIIRHISRDFDFFKLMKNAKKIDNNHYIAKFEESDITITLKDSKLFSLTYKDKFDNDVVIFFSKQIQNHEIPIDTFRATYPTHYDLITE